MRTEVRTLLGSSKLNVGFFDHERKSFKVLANRLVSWFPGFIEEIQFSCRKYWGELGPLADLRRSFLEDEIPLFADELYRRILL